MSVEVTLTGPVFDGRATKIIAKLGDDTTEVVADQGVTDVNRLLDTVLRNPTGFYQSRLTTQRVHRDQILVTDGGVVYGPWLAGTSPRNRTSRFKGYTHWRRAAQKLQREVTKITRPVLARRTRELNR